MKRILFILMALIAVSSCLDDGSGVGQEYSLVATFQYNGIEFGADSTFVNSNDAIGFGYDALNFFHSLDAGKTIFQGGFILSCLDMPKTGFTMGLANTYRANVPKTSTKGNIYTVFYQNPEPSLMPEHDVEFAFDENGTCTMGGCYITNTVEVADAVKKNFKLGDRLSLKAIGYYQGAKTGEVEFLLADYSAQKDSIVSRWTPLELTQLGKVEFVDFEISSTNPEIPTSFCLDNMIATISIEY